MAIQKGGTVFDLEEAELCYAPQFGSAKDPVNMAGMIAANVVRGDAQIAHWKDLGGTPALILDVRDLSEFQKGSVVGATHIPLRELRRRMTELPQDRDIWAYCFVGQRSYYACRALQQYGYRIKNLSGGYKAFLQSRPLPGPA
jgi:rhodanese-related sulfurtransferase